MILTSLVCFCKVETAQQYYNNSRVWLQSWSERMSYSTSNSDLVQLEHKRNLVAHQVVEYNGRVEGYEKRETTYGENQANVK